MPRTVRPAAQTREHVLATAHELFYWHGIRATGIDRVAAEAGVAPTTLYRLFPSKDDLVAAYVERADAGYRVWFEESIEAGGSDPRGRIVALFDALLVQIRPDNFRGCPYLMALSEYPDRRSPVCRNAIGVKEWVLARLTELVADLGGPREPAEQLAEQLMVVMEGVYATAQGLGEKGPARQAPAIVEALLGPPGRLGHRKQPQ